MAEIIGGKLAEPMTKWVDQNPAIKSAELSQ
jgi:hypothetical protein